MHPCDILRAPDARMGKRLFCSELESHLELVVEEGSGLFAEAERRSVALCLDCLATRATSAIHSSGFSLLQDRGMLS